MEGGKQTDRKSVRERVQRSIFFKFDQSCLKSIRHTLTKSNKQLERWVVGRVEIVDKPTQFDSDRRDLFFLIVEPGNSNHQQNLAISVHGLGVCSKYIDSD